MLPEVVAGAASFFTPRRGVDAARAQEKWLQEQLQARRREAQSAAAAPGSADSACVRWQQARAGPSLEARMCACAACARAPRAAMVRHCPLPWPRARRCARCTRRARPARPLASRRSGARCYGRAPSRSAPQPRAQERERERGRKREGEMQGRRAGGQAETGKAGRQARRAGGGHTSQTQGQTPVFRTDLPGRHEDGLSFRVCSLLAFGPRRAHTWPDARLLCRLKHIVSPLPSACSWYSRTHSSDPGMPVVSYNY